MRRVAVLSALLCVGALSIALGAVQQPAGTRVADGAKLIELEKLNENLYILKGGGGNTVVFLTDLGVVVVDTKLAGWGQPLMDKIKLITKKPVTTLINTHAHGDHTGSNESFGTAVEIVAQDNTRANMERMDAFKGGKVNFLPKLMFKDKMTLGAGKDKIELYYFGAGHTNGDAWVVFPAIRVMHAGDMFAAKQVPIIDRINGGSGIAYSDTLAKAATVTRTAVDAIVTGHGGIVTTSDLEEYARFNRDFRNVVVDGFDHGLSVSEVVARWKMPDAYRGYASGDPERVRDNISQMFGELSK
jgi:glyoxylase-like metal-dependent hydrolase (beta-lactamase superfamily II)